jgi:hypothetical protein
LGYGPSHAVNPQGKMRLRTAMEEDFVPVFVITKLFYDGIPWNFG